MNEENKMCACGLHWGHTGKHAPAYSKETGTGPAMKVDTGMKDQHLIIEEAKNSIYSAFFKERDGTISKLDVTVELDNALLELAWQARKTVLLDFDNMCVADSFVGFTEDEWKAIKKFFDFNKKLSGWDKDKE